MRLLLCMLKYAHVGVVVGGGSGGLRTMTSMPRRVHQCALVQSTHAATPGRPPGASEISELWANQVDEAPTHLLHTRTTTSLGSLIPAF